jgi:hypothetical protein
MFFNFCLLVCLFFCVCNINMHISVDTVFWKNRSKKDKEK